MKFSVVIPVYNKAKTLTRAIQSVLNQSLSNEYEIVVVDDGSTDEIDLVIKQFSGLKVIKQKNAGVSVARNEGIMIASGDYICFLDADDEWLANHLEILNVLISNHPEYDYFSTSHIVIHPDGKVFHSSTYLSSFKKDDYICNNLFKLQNSCKDGVIHTNSICVKKSLLISNNLFFEPGEKIGEDTDMWYRIALQYVIVISKVETTIYRREDSTATKDTMNNLSWKFASRVDNGLLDEWCVDKAISNECIRLIDRYRLTCCRDYAAMGKKKDAFNTLKKISTKKGKRYFLTLLFCTLPHRLSRKILRSMF